MKPIVAALVLMTAATAHSQAQTGPSQEYNGEFARPATDQSTDRIIVKWRSAAMKAATATARTQKASSASGIALQKQQSLTDDIDVMLAPQKLSGAALEAVLENLRADAAVAYASADLRRHAHALTSDPLLSTQWYLLGDQSAATRTHLAWDVTTGSPTTIVAVLDTGVRPEHPDLGSVDQGGKLLAGYDFVTNAQVANDGDGRDADPTDPGDWVSTADTQTSAFAGCDVTSSSWHGTRTSGLIGALTDNSVGVAGTAWNTAILPVRVLGKCGGFDSDIIAGMRWAAGLTVSGAPTNPNPADVINLSLGGSGACSAAYQAAVDEILDRGVLLVISAGNEGGPVATPANCDGVLGVAGLRHIGTKVGFSNVGTEIGIGAPGGNCVNTGAGQPCLFSIVVPLNTGTTTPVASSYSDQLNYNVGTSFSAPLAAGAAALMHSVNSALTPAQLIKLMKESASPYPTSTSTGIQDCHVPVSATDLQTAECTCTTQTCGAGMLNTGEAVNAAVRPLAIFNTSGTVASGSTITADGSSSFASNGRTLTTFQWSVLSVTGATPTITSPAQPMTTLQITGDSSFTLRLTVTDSNGAQDTEDLALATPTTPTNPTTPTSSVSGGGGGGGALGWEVLGLSLLALARRRQKK